MPRTKRKTKVADNVWSQRPLDKISLLIVKANDPNLVGMWMEIDSSNVAFIHYPSVEIILDGKKHKEFSVTAAKPDVSFLRRLVDDKIYEAFARQMEKGHPNGHRR